MDWDGKFSPQELLAIDRLLDDCSNSAFNAKLDVLEYYLPCGDKQRDGQLTYWNNVISSIKWIKSIAHSRKRKG